MIRCVVMLLLAVSAAGCAVNQNNEVEIYRREIRLTDARVEHVPGEALSLTDAILLANQNDEILASRGEDYVKAVIAQRRTLANFLPTVDLVPVYSRRESVTSESVTSASGTSGQDRYFDVPVAGSINLFNGFQDVNRAWRDEYVARQRRAELKYAQEQLLVDTASVFFAVLRAEATVRVLDSSLELQDARYREAKGRFDAGVARPLEVSQTEAQVASTRTTLISARADIIQARSRLKLLTAAAVRTSPLADNYFPPALTSFEAIYEAARNHRDDVRAAELAVDAARHEVDAAIGQYYPSVSLDLEAFLYRESVPDTRSWEALLRINLPIFSAGRIEQDVRAAWSNLRQALLARSYAQRRMRSEVEQAYVAAQASIDRLAQLQVQVVTAQEALRQSEESYNAGLATNLDRITSQNALLQSQLALVSEEYDRKLLHLALLQRAGILREQFEQAAMAKP